MTKDLYAETFEELHGESIEQEIEARSCGEVRVIGANNGGIDSIASAAALAHIKNVVDISRRYIPQRCGEPDEAARFAVEYFEAEMPEAAESVDPGSSIILVAHNDAESTVPGAEEADIIEIVDNHRLNSLKTRKPLFVRCEPQGATASIIYSMYKEEEEDIPKNIAGLMCAAIIYETDMLKSEETTQHDKIAVVELANTCGLDLAEFSSKLLNRG